jgi:hypothetical protein
MDLNEEYDLYPCTPLQAAMFSTSVQDSSAYVAQQVWKCTPEMDSVKLFQAWNQVIEKHSILRTTFVSTSEGIYQICFPRSNVTLEKQHGDLKSVLKKIIEKRISTRWHSVCEDDSNYRTQ